MEMINEIDDVIISFEYIVQFQDSIESEIGNLKNSLLTCVRSNKQIICKLDLISEKQTPYEQAFDFFMIKRKQEILFQRLLYAQEIMNRLKQYCEMNSFLLDKYDTELNQMMIRMDEENLLNAEYGQQS